jgi:hypothetical protein
MEVAARIAADAQARGQPVRADPTIATRDGNAAEGARASREITSPGEGEDLDPGGPTDPGAGYPLNAEGERVEIEPEMETNAWGRPAPIAPRPLAGGVQSGGVQSDRGYVPAPPPSAPISAPWAAPALDLREDLTNVSPPSMESPRVGVNVIILIAAAASFTVALALGVWLLLFRKGEEPPVAAPQPSAGLVHPASSIPKPPPAVDVDTEARQALERLRDGVQSCVRDTIRVLPGSSPAVPPTLKRMKDGAYESTVADWRTPVWICAKYRVSGPQRFQIQWQQEKVRSAGMGMVWIDANGDGVADRAFGFRATLKKRGEVEMGEIQAIDAARPVATVR